MKSILLNKLQLFCLISSIFGVVLIFCLFSLSVNAQVPDWGLYVPTNDFPFTETDLLNYCGIDPNEVNYYAFAHWYDGSRGRTYDIFVYTCDKNNYPIVYRPSINGDRGWLIRPGINQTGTFQTYNVAYNKNVRNGFERTNPVWNFWYDNYYVAPNIERLETSYTYYPQFTNSAVYHQVDNENETDNFAFVSQEYIDNLPDTSLDDLLNSSIFGNGQITGHAKPPEMPEDTTTTSNSTDGFLQKILNSIRNGFNNINGYFDNALTNLETFFTPFLQSINKGIGSIFQKINDTLDYVFEPLDTTSVLDAFSGTLLYQLYDSSGSIGGLLKSLLTYTTPVPSLTFDIDYDFLGLEGTITLDFDWYNEIREDFLNVFLPFFYFGYAFYFIKQLPNIIGGISSGVNRNGD